MEFNISPSRLKTPFAYYEPQTGSDSKGRPLPAILVAQPLWFDVKTQGDQFVASNDELTGITKTLLGWNDPRVKHTGYLLEIKTGIKHEIQFVNRGNSGQAMIVTTRAVIK